MIIYLEALGGLVLLLAGGDGLVRGAVGLAKRGNLPPLFIGLTIVAFGTSAPELVICIQAVLSDLPSIAIGNVVGSNIANVLLVLGLPALITPLICKGKGVWRTSLIMVAATIAFMLAAARGYIGPYIGGLFFGFLVIFLIVSTLRAKRTPLDESGLVDTEALEEKPQPLPVALFLTAGGIAGLVFGSHFLVEGGAAIAARLGVSEAVIGLTLVAIGTSLPELATSVTAALRKHTDLAIGNVVGSNLFNLLAIIGITAMVRPITVSDHFLAYDMWVMLGSSALLLPIIWRHGVIGRMTGSIFLAAYIIYIASLSQSWG